jgi:DNA polymerase I-like protein with 3'-5' exonuclease and polymerase domains
MHASPVKELVLGAPDDEIEATMEFASKVTVEATKPTPEPAVRTAVPLGVDARAAGNWDGAH